MVTAQDNQLVALVEAAIDMVEPGSAVHELLVNGLEALEPNHVQYTHDELRAFANDLNVRAAEDLRRRRHEARTQQG